MLSAHTSPAYLISGILDRRQNQSTGKTLYYNGVAVFDTQGQMTPVYSKTHLVPFGEFIPFQEWIPLKPVVAFSGFEKGSGSTSVAMTGIPVFSPLVCYEIIFPAEAATRNPLPPRWIVNVTNDAWYGKSAGPPQHFAHSIFRSIENGVPVIRSANTGISGMTDPLGRVLAKTKLDTEDNLILPLPQPLSALPLYMYIKDAGFLILVILFLLFGGCIRAVQNSMKKKT
jgi:apolipoprotein N-acyltransferase